MAASEVAIANLALAHLGADRAISSLSESTKHAVACNTFYTQARDKLLADFAWPFATKWATLTLVEAEPVGVDEWNYSYRVPTDAAGGWIRRVLTATQSRSDLIENRTVYRLGKDATGGLIYTDEITAEVEYTEKITDVTKYPPDFVDALSWYLAFLIAPMVTGGDQFKLGEKAFQMYRHEIGNAWANALNRTQPDLPATSSFERARD